MSDYKDMSEIEKLRHLADLSGYVRESLWDDLTREQILRVCDAWMASGWDFYPDQWTQAQLTDAIRYGIAPAWDPATELAITYAAAKADIWAIIDENGDTPCS